MSGSDAQMRPPRSSNVEIGLGTSKTPLLLLMLPVSRQLSIPSSYHDAIFTSSPWLLLLAIRLEGEQRVALHYCINTAVSAISFQYILTLWGHIKTEEQRTIIYSNTVIGTMGGLLH